MASAGLFLAAPMMVLGILQLISALSLIIADIISFALLDWLSMVLVTAGASGIWAGIFFLITASFGIAGGAPLKGNAAPRGRQCPIITSIVLSVMSALCTFSLMITFGIFLSWNPYELVSCDISSAWLDTNSIWGYGYRTTTMSPDCSTWRDQGQALLKAHLAFSIIMFIASVAQVVVASMNLGRMPNRTTTTTVQYVNRPAQPMVVVQGGHPGAPPAYGQPGYPAQYPTGGGPAQYSTGPAPYPAGASPYPAGAAPYPAGAAPYPAGAAPQQPSGEVKY